MSDKPSLYVVERKEVVILVVLFVLVTVLSFTVGVRYGEKIGRKLSREELSVQKEKDSDFSDKNGGTLGDSNKAETAPTTGSAAPKLDATLKTEKSEKSDKAGDVKVEAAKPGEVKKDDPNAPVVGATTLGAVDANSDDALLSALKSTAVEPPSGKSPSGKVLPEESKAVKAGSFVIQVGSHPTKHEAEDQVHTLKGEHVGAQILPPFKDKQGEWFRVVIGSYKTKNDAEKEAKQLKTKGLIYSFFVRKM